MKIGILTHCLGYNYGGLLQNYALQQILIKLGHEPMTINHQPRPFSHKRRFFSICKRLLKKIYGSELPVIGIPSEKQFAYITRFINEFKERCIVKTYPLQLSNLKNNNVVSSFHAIIVGSDQVWRYRMMKNEILEMFLSSFQGFNIKKISYAASFGTDKWEMPPHITKLAKSLVHQFDAVSVRENSAITMCKANFGIDVDLVLDPTLLLTAEDYMKVVRTSPFTCIGRPHSLLTYILDKDTYKCKLVDLITIRTGLIKYELYPKSQFSKVGINGIEDCVFPSVEEWLNGFYDAEMVITDSFHGTVFSIIFNKPFWVIGNVGRGMARFESLLSLFGLERRLISDYPIDINEPIDWTDVNNRLERHRMKSIKFLEDNLS